MAATDRVGMSCTPAARCDRKVSNAAGKSQCCSFPPVGTMRTNSMAVTADHAEDCHEPRLWNFASHGLAARRKATNARTQTLPQC